MVYLLTLPDPGSQGTTGRTILFYLNVRAVLGSLEGSFPEQRIRIFIGTMYNFELERVYNDQEDGDGTDDDAMHTPYRRTHSA